MGGSYVEIRLEFDNSELRKSKKNPQGKWIRVRPMGGPQPPQISKYNRGDNKNLTVTEVKAWRQKYIEDFPKAVIDINSYHGINQGREGACSFVAFLNMIHLTGRDELFKGKQWKDKRSRRQRIIKGVKNGWKTMWNKLKICAAEDIAEMLDLVNENKILGDFSTSLVYFPIRSRGHRENNFNIQVAGDTFEKTIEKIQAKIEGLIAKGIPVEINYAEHSRVAVGYNKTHLLFADSWGDYYYEQSADGRDTNAAGFSTVKKDVVYAYAREIAYFDSELEKALSNLKIANVEETSKDDEKKDPRDAFRKNPRRSTRNGRPPQKYGVLNLKF